MKHAFISYVSEDDASASRLASELRARGLKVWMDKDSIHVGQPWKIALEEAIADGAYFIACYSDNFWKKSSNVMNQELTLAAEMLSKMHVGQTWFIPAMLSDCRISEHNVGAGRTLSSFHKAKLYEDWDYGIEQILETMGLATQRRRRVTLKAMNEPDAAVVEVWGEFNGWREGVTMNKTNQSFEITLTWPIGPHEFKFKVDGSWRDDMREPYPTVSNKMGAKNYLITVA